DLDPKVAPPPRIPTLSVGGGRGPSRSDSASPDGASSVYAPVRRRRIRRVGCRRIVDGGGRARRPTCRRPLPLPRVEDRVFIRAPCRAGVSRQRAFLYLEL